MEVEMLSRIAVIYGDLLNLKDKAKEYADRAASINPGQYCIFSAYHSAGIEYDPSEYEDIFNQNNEEHTIKPIMEDLNSSEIDKYITVNPNPANPMTTITYSIEEPSYVKLVIYSVTGQRVATLVDSYISAGKHSVVFNGSKLASGVYLYNFKSKEFIKRGKILLVR